MIQLRNILKVINENFNQRVFDLVDDNRKRYYKRINREWDGSFFDKVRHHKDFVVIHGNKVGSTHTGKPNKCETNTFHFIKNKISSGEGDRYFPVGGYHITNSGTTVEHWWVYDKNTNKHMETCPFNPDDAFAYAGVINYDIQNEISGASWVFDVDFFKSGNPYYYYFK